MREEYVPDFCQHPTLVLGCGNILFGDDGFGPAVVTALQEDSRVPDDACVLDAGTGVQDILCVIALASQRPRRIIVVDAMDTGAKPGEVSIATLDETPARPTRLSLHQSPTLDLLKELRDTCGIDVRLVLVQPEVVPEEVQEGLSDKVRLAVKEACNLIEQEYLRNGG